VQAEKLRLAEAQMAPRLLAAPMAGTVSSINKFCGESVVAADPVVTLSSIRSERVIGFLRQPFFLNPTTNMVVQVRTRGFHRQIGMGHILAVGESLLPINDVLLPPTKYNTTENGLPLLISLPPELRQAVRPGEYVDITIIPTPKG
jgi:hypothetical protein